MPPNKALTRKPASSPPVRLFTLERANRALVYVRPIVADIVARYHELVELRSQVHALADEPANETRRDDLSVRVDHCVDTLDRLHRELSAVGCFLKDWRFGLVDFPAEREGRQVWLCWRLGEPRVGHWHEKNDGLAGRKPAEPEDPAWAA
jgi:hypothetical protein